MKPGIVHRIDKHTSGLLVIGKHMSSCKYLIDQFMDHSITREYLAIAHNKLPKELWTEENYIERHPTFRTQFHVLKQPQRSPFSLLTRDDVRDENIIRAKLGRMSYEQEEKLKKQQQERSQILLKYKQDSYFDQNESETMSGSMDGVDLDKQRQKSIGRAKLAVTHFRELETFEYIPKKQKKIHKLSLLNCNLSTGRTHQVRVHCHNMKIPIVGDNTYFVKEYKKYEQELFNEISNFEEMHYLHAYLLKFQHPNGRIGQFTANPPEMFTKVLGRLRTIPIMSQ